LVRLGLRGQAALPSGLRGNARSLLVPGLDLTAFRSQAFGLVATNGSSIRPRGDISWQ
jgi:hypothetical protein